MFCEIYSLPKKSTQRTLLLDRDNTIIHDDGYFHDVNSMNFLDHNFDFIELLCRKNISVFLISNQSGIGRGIFELKDALSVNRAIAEFWSSNKGQLNGAIFCPHTPQDACQCRKPSPAMLEMAISISGSSKSNTLFIGDSSSDFSAANNANISFVQARKNGVRELLLDWI